MADAKQRRTLDWQSLDDAVADARMLHEKGYERVGNWDLTQNLDHICNLLNAAMDGFSFRMPRIIPWLMKVSGMTKKTFRTRSLRQGLPAPKPMQPDAPAANPQDETRAVEAFAASVERFKQHTAPLHPSPVFGKLDKAGWNELNIIHAMHHLSFLLPNEK